MPRLLSRCLVVFDSALFSWGPCRGSILEDGTGGGVEYGTGLCEFIPSNPLSVSIDGGWL